MRCSDCANDIIAKLLNAQMIESNELYNEAKERELFSNLVC